MNIAVGAKNTKPGSKATAKRSAMVNGRPPRVPVGVLHIIDMADQSANGAMFTAVCGESALTSIDGSWDDDYPNDRCNICSDKQWAESFGEMQAKLLPFERKR